MSFSQQFTMAGCYIVYIIHIITNLEFEFHELNFSSRPELQQNFLL